jgi:hypothetical protein
MQVLKMSAGLEEGKKMGVTNCGGKEAVKRRYKGGIMKLSAQCSVDKEWAKKEL